MKKYDDLYCKLFVNWNTNRNNWYEDERNLTNFIKDKMDGNLDGGEIITKYCAIYVNKNVEFDKNKILEEEEDSFLYYPYFLDIEPLNSEINQNDYIKEIKTLLSNFWENKIDAIAACHFEEQLYD